MHTAPLASRSDRHHRPANPQPYGTASGRLVRLWPLAPSQEPECHRSRDRIA